MTVLVVADDAASVPLELATERGIRLVPMQLEIAGRPATAGEVSLAEVVAQLDQGVRTAGPSPGAFAEALEDVGEDGAVVVTLARRFSSTFQAANAAALGVARGPVRVLDTGSAAGGEGLVALAAAEVAARGATLEEVVRRAELVADRVRLVAALERLTYLLRGGHVPTAFARLGGRVGVRVLFELRHAHIRPLRPGRARTSAVDQLLSVWRRSVPETPGWRLHVAALHALAADDAATLLEAVVKEADAATAFVASFGPVMVAHTGPGLLGLAWWWEGPLAA